MHTFLFEEGRRGAEGVYWNEFGDASPSSERGMLLRTIVPSGEESPDDLIFLALRCSLSA